MKKWQKVCGTISLLLFTSLLLFSLIGLESLIDQVILDGAVLDPNTMETWSQNPGSTGTLTLRNFTFYNLINPRQFLYRGEKPKFLQKSNYLLQQRSNMTNIVYSQDRSYIDFNSWTYFTSLNNSRDLQQKVTVMNLAPIGFWTQLQGLQLSSLAIQGFGGLYLGLNSSIKLQAIGQGVAGQYLSNYSSWSSHCKILQIPDVQCQWMYDDPHYGLGNQSNYQIWVEWSFYNNTDAQFLIYEYFGLKRLQLQNFDKFFEKWCRSIEGVLDNWYCGGPCKTEDLTILQLSSSGVTRNPPTGDATDSICLSPAGHLTQNLSCQGFPQIYSFHKYWFPKINNGSEFKSLNFSQKTVRALYTPYRGTLLNVGNLSRLFVIGNKYDSNKTIENLDRLTEQTHAQSSNHAIVIWQYVKYFANEFVLQAKDKGTKKIAGLGGVFSQALYQSFIQFQDWIQRQLLSILVAQKISNCSKFLIDNTESISQGRILKICQNINPNNYRQYYNLIEPCNNQYFIDISKDQLNLRDYQIYQICYSNKSSLLSIIEQAHAILHQNYNCSNKTGSKRCTKYQLGLKQFINSEITQKPLNSTIKQYQKSWSGKDWNNDLQQWQFRHFLDIVHGDSKFGQNQICKNQMKLIDLLSFDILFNGPMIQNLTLVQNATLFQELFCFKNKSLLMEYIKFVTIQVGLGGFTQTRTVKELLFGYQDQFLKNLKQMDTMLGGDPSIDPLIVLNDVNSTLQQCNSPQSLYTGYSDPMLTRTFRTFHNYDYVTYNKTYYDGYKVISELANPFKQKSPLYGSDASQQKPLSTPDDKQYIFIDSLYRVGELKFDKVIDRYGFKALRYVISDRMMASSAQYPPNQNFYQGIRTFMNLSFMGLPLFASKNHFLGAQRKWVDLVQIYDETGQHPQYPSQYDETEVVMEPKSGATFTASLYLQTNVFLPQDILFTPQARMLPLFTLYRSGNMTEEAANDLLGDLKIALQAPRKLILLSSFGILFTISLMIACNMKSKRSKEINSSLLSSTNEEGKLEEANLQS